jgi:hypothetical protein
VTGRHGRLKVADQFHAEGLSSFGHEVSENLDLDSIIGVVHDDLAKKSTDKRYPFLPLIVRRIVTQHEHGAKCFTQVSDLGFVLDRTRLIAGESESQFERLDIVIDRFDEL